MNADDPKLSATWISSLRDTRFDLNQNRAIFQGLQRDWESAAEPIITMLIERTIADGIESCSRRGSNSLLIEIPATVLETAAFARLRGWLASQGLCYMIMDFAPGQHGAVLASLAISPAN